MTAKKKPAPVNVTVAPPNMQYYYEDPISKKILPVRAKELMITKPILKPVHIPTPETREMVVRMLMVGKDLAFIANILKMTVRSVQNHYKAEIQKGRIDALGLVAKTMFDIATDPNHKGCVAAGTLILRSRAGWSEKSTLEITDNTTEKKTETIDSLDLTQEERDLLRKALKKAVAAQEASANQDLIALRQEDIEEFEEAEFEDAEPEAEADED